MQLGKTRDNSTQPCLLTRTYGDPVVPYVVSFGSVHWSVGVLNLDLDLGSTLNPWPPTRALTQAAQSVAFCEMMAPLFRPIIFDKMLTAEAELRLTPNAREQVLDDSAWGLDHLFCALARTLAREDYEHAREAAKTRGPTRSWPFGLDSRGFSFGNGLAGAANRRLDRRGWALALEREAGGGAGRGCVLLESSVMVHKDSRAVSLLCLMFQPLYLTFHLPTYVCLTFTYPPHRQLTASGSSLLGSSVRQSLGIAPQGRMNDQNWEAMSVRWKWIKARVLVPFSSDKGGDIYRRGYGKAGDEGGAGNDGPSTWRMEI